MFDQLYNRLVSEGVLMVTVRVRPHAPDSRLVTLMDDGSIKADLAAPAEGGKANRALIRLLAGAFGVSASNVRILAGETARRKLVKIVR